MKSKQILCVVFLVLCSFFVATTQVVAFTVPDYDGLVNDYADVLSPEVEASLETHLQEVATATAGAEVAVVTISSLQGEPIEDVSQQFFDTWKIGKDELDNGVLFLIAKDDRELRIQTGYGVEGVLPDSKAGRIIRQVVVPEFQAGNFENGIVEGTDAILVAILDPEAASLPEEESTSVVEDTDWTWVAMILYFIFIFGSTLFTYVAAFFGRTKEWWPGGVVGFILGSIFGGLPVGVILGLLGLLLDFILSSNYKRWSVAEKSTGWKDTWGGFKTSSYSSSSSSSSSSSGFSSFGGGSSGGGGASGKW